MKKHGKEFKKAQTGAAINASQIRQSAFKPLSYQDQFNDVDKMLTGSTEAERQELALKQQQATASQGGGGGGFDIAGLMKLAGGAMQGGEGMEGMGDMGGAASGAGAGVAAAARYGADIPMAQDGDWYSKNPIGGSTSYGQVQPIDSELKPAGSTNPLATGGVGGFNISKLGPQGVGSKAEDNALSKIGGALGKYAGPVGDIISGMGELQKEKEAKKEAEQARDVSRVSLKAAQSIDVDKQRQQSENISKQREAQMPVNTGEEFFPIYGVGTNVLARNGLRLQGGGEIQNTYDPYDIYEDSGYEPLNDSNIKQYYHGGRLHQMQDGGAAGGGTPWGMIGQKVTGMGQSLAGGQNAGGKIGGTIGSGIGTAIGGPLGGAIGNFVGGMAGNLLDKNGLRTKKAQEETQRNMQGMANANMAKGIQAQNQSYMKDGGWVSHDWQPQVIASFGGLDEQEVYDYAHEGMDTLRAGGHLRDYTPPSDRAMEIYEDGGEIESYGLGGQLQTHWGGKAETISHNPYLPGSGETVAFRGQSHTESDGNGQTGIGITYGDNPVEVERGEPMFEMQSGGEVDPETGEPQNTGVVFGNMQVNKNVAKQFKDPELMAIADKYHGKKFKNIGLALSKDEAKQNKLIDKTINELEALKINTPFDKLKLSALRMNLEGADAKLRQLANTKITLANYQNAINDAKEEISEGVGSNISAEDLSRGYVKLDKDPVTRNAKWGDAIEKAEGGKTVTKETTKKPTIAEAIARGFEVDPKTGRGKKLRKKAVAPTEKTVVTPGDKGTKGEEGRAAVAPKKDTYKGPKMSNADWLKFLASKQGQAYKEKYITGTPEVKAVEAKAATPDITEVIKTPGAPAEYEEIETEEPTEESGIPWWAKVANAAIPLLRPTDQEGLDSAQLYPEMFAMATNQVEPVPAQFYRPDLNIPYDISYQDQLNANQADYRAAQRTMGYNPAAQANLNAQKYQANQSVLANQFRANQEMKDKVYSGNREVLNQAKMTNLGIAANQWDKQALARSNTKATTQAALNSIADKYAKNKLENRTLGIYENMYNYRFGKSGRAQNYNPLQFFDTDFGGGKEANKGLAKGKGFTYDENGNIVGVRSLGKDEDADLEAVGGIKGKNGTSTKKNYKNSSVVRAYKNI